MAHANAKLTIYGRRLIIERWEAGWTQAEAYDKQVAAVGQGNLAGIEVAKAIAAAGLKITPDVLVSGGGDGSSSNVFAAFMAQLLAQNASGGAPESKAG